MGELEGECREDDMKITPILKISGTKETCTQFPVREAGFRNCLRNCRLSGSCKSVEPEDASVPLIH